MHSWLGYHGVTLGTGRDVQTEPHLASKITELVAGAVLALYTFQPNWCKTGKCLAGGEEKAHCLGLECITWEAGVSHGGQKYSLAAAGNALSWPSHI